MPRRGDRDRRRGADQGVDLHRRQPGAVASQRRAPRRRPRLARPDGVDRHLPQRDITERRRHPAGAVGAGETALRRRPAAARRAQRRQLVRPGAAAPRRSARRVGDPRPPRADRPGSGRCPGVTSGRCPTRPSSTTSSSARSSVRRSATSTGRCTAATPTSCSRRWRRAPGRRGSSTSTCAAGPTATTSAPTLTGLTLDALIAAPHGIDLGPLEPRLPDGLRTPTGMIDVAPQPILDDLPRMEAALARHDDGMLLIGRRDLRSNNSWMHNVEVLVKGKPQCVLHVHPDDAASKGLIDGGQAKVTSRVGTVVVPGRGHRRHPPRRRQPAARLGPRPARQPARRRRPPRRRQLQPAQRRPRRRGAHRHRHPQRHPRRARPRLTIGVFAATECHAPGLQHRHSDAANTPIGTGYRQVGGRPARGNLSPAVPWRAARVPWSGRQSRRARMQERSWSYHCSEPRAAGRTSSSAAVSGPSCCCRQQRHCSPSASGSTSPARCWPPTRAPRRCARSPRRSRKAPRRT